MTTSVLNRVRSMYDPDLRLLAISLGCSGFLLLLLLDDPDLASAAYLFAVVAMACCVVAAASALAYEYRRD